MKKYDALIETLEKHKDIPDECGHSIFEQTAEAIGALQSVIDEKQRLLDEALQDLAKSNECKYCSNIDQCSLNRIDRNLAYGSCSKWQWHGAKTAEKAS